jgi:hypothetical protein
MIGVVAHWFQSYKHTPGFQLWDHFALAVVAEFVVDTHKAKTMELLFLRQTGSMEEYRKCFEQLVYTIKLFDNTLSSTMLTTQFLLGLKPELKSPSRNATARFYCQGHCSSCSPGTTLREGEERSL